MFRRTLYLSGLLTYKLVVKISARWFGQRMSLVIRRIGVAVRFVIFPEYSEPLGERSSYRPSTPGSVSQMPAWLAAEIRWAASHIDPTLLPAGDPQSLYRGTSIALTLAPGEALRSLFEQCHHDYYNLCAVVTQEQFKEFNDVFLSEYRLAGSERNPILIIVTAGRLSDAVCSHNLDVVYTEASFRDLDMESRAYILSRFLIQAKVQQLHLVLSSLTCECAVQFGRQLGEMMLVFVHGMGHLGMENSALDEAVRVAHQSTGKISGWAFVDKGTADAFALTTGLHASTPPFVRLS